MLKRHDIGGLPGKAGTAAILILLAVAWGAWATRAPKALAEDIKVVCPSPLPKAPTISRADVYKDVPFKIGESAVYEVSWGGLKVGDATLEVRAPRKENDVWQRIFHVQANTGEW